MGDPKRQPSLIAHDAINRPTLQEHCRLNDPRWKDGFLWTTRTTQPGCSGRLPAPVYLEGKPSTHPQDLLEEIPSCRS